MMQTLSVVAEQSAEYTSASASKAILAEGFRENVTVSLLISNFTGTCSVT